MSKKQTLFEQRKAMKALRNERLANGMCQECGEQPRTSNLDNTRSVHCEPCKQAKARAAWTSMHGPGKRPPSTDEWGMVENYGHFDDGRLDAYAVKVKSVIHAADHATSIADQKRALGEDFNVLMHMDALGELMSAGEIRERQSGAMMRYEPCGRHDRNTITFGRDFQPFMLPGSSRTVKLKVAA